MDWKFQFSYAVFGKVSHAQLSILVSDAHTMEVTANQWIEQQSELIPICALNDSRHSASLKELIAARRDILGSNREAMLWLRIGLIERPHDIVQSATNGIPAYIHGVVHRLEGDYWNANYWFRRVGNSALIEDIASAVSQHGNVDSFDPTDFTNQVEAWNRSKDSAKSAELQRIATQEWEALWAML